MSKIIRDKMIELLRDNPSNIEIRRDLNSLTESEKINKYINKVRDAITISPASRYSEMNNNEQILVATAKVAVDNFQFIRDNEDLASFVNQMDDMVVSPTDVIISNILMENR